MTMATTGPGRNPRLTTAVGQPTCIWKMRSHKIQLLIHPLEHPTGNERSCHPKPSGLAIPPSCIPTSEYFPSNCPTTCALLDIIERTSTTTTKPLTYPTMITTTVQLDANIACTTFHSADTNTSTVSRDTRHTLGQASQSTPIHGHAPALNDTYIHTYLHYTRVSRRLSFL